MMTSTDCILQNIGLSAERIRQMTAGNVRRTNGRLKPGRPLDVVSRLILEHAEKRRRIDVDDVLGVEQATGHTWTRKHMLNRLRELHLHGHLVKVREGRSGPRLGVGISGRPALYSLPEHATTS